MSCSLKNPDGSYRSRPDDHIPSLSSSWITPILPRGVERLIGLGDGTDLILVDAASGMHWGHLTIGDDPSDPPTTALLIQIGSPSVSAASPLAVLTHNGPHWIELDIHGRRLHETAYRCRPARHLDDGSANAPSMSWRHVPPFLELVVLDDDGAVSGAKFEVDDNVFELIALRVAKTDGGYRGAILARTNVVVAWRRDRIDWLTFHADRFRQDHRLNVNLGSVVACFSAIRDSDILVVDDDGSILRVTRNGLVRIQTRRTAPNR